MNRHSFIVILGSVIAMIVAMSSCKTTEANYKAAYEAAKAKQDESGGIDSTVFSNLRPQGRGGYVHFGNDSLEVHTITVGYTKDGGASAETLRRYNVVVGQFKQVFNAKAMRQRLIDNGFDSAMVIHTREPLYYVVARSCATPAEAAEAVKSVKKQSAIVVRPPFPWVLCPAHMSK